jgi:hypothetical protein
VTAPVECPRCGIDLGRSHSIVATALHVRHCAGPVARFAVEAWLRMVLERPAVSTYGEVVADLARQESPSGPELVDEAWLSVEHAGGRP